MVDTLVVAGKLVVGCTLELVCRWHVAGKYRWAGRLWEQACRWAGRCE